jgi:hypothetical protein
LTFELLVVIDDLDVMGVTTHPTETNAPLIIDADAVLPVSVPYSFRIAAFCIGSANLVLRSRRKTRSVSAS